MKFVQTVLLKYFIFLLVAAVPACSNQGAGFNSTERRLGELPLNGSERGDGGRRVEIDPAQLEKDRAGKAETMLDPKAQDAMDQQSRQSVSRASRLGIEQKPIPSASQAPGARAMN